MTPHFGARLLPVRGLRGQIEFAAIDRVAEEVAVALEFNGLSHTVMLASPGDLADFALGFALTEGIVDGRHEFYGVEEDVSALGITLRLEVSGAAFARLKERRRSMAGRTGCGLCGTESLAQVVRDLPELTGMVSVVPGAIARAMAELAAGQALQKETGAVHAAAWCSVAGEVQALREDIGRHNALDKLVGALAARGIDASTGFVVITSRASFEMVQKTAAAGVGLLAAVSAPTSLAVASADRLGLTLVGFARQDDFVVYSRSDRVAFGAGPRPLA